MIKGRLKKGGDMRVEKRVGVFVFCFWLAVIVMAPLAAFSEVGRTINYQGYLTDGSGNSVDGTILMTLSIYDVETEGEALWFEAQSIIVEEGVYSILLGSDPENPLDIPFNTLYFLGVRVEEDPEMEPRQQLTSVPYAIMADDTDTVDGMHASELQRRITGTCQSGSTIQVVNPDGSVLCESGSFFEEGEIYSAGAISIKSDEGNIIIAAGTSRITVFPSGSIVIEGGSDVTVQAGNSLNMIAQDDVNITAGGVLDLNGAVIDLN